MTRSRPQPRAEQRRKVLALMAKSQKRSKYRAVRCEVDGEKFDSQREMNRWLALKQRERVGDVRDLKRQPRFVLMAPWMGPSALHDCNAWEKSYRREVVGHYVADFSYYLVGDGREPCDRFVVEDCKGMRTQTYKLKRRHFEAQYGLTILET